VQWCNSKKKCNGAIVKKYNLLRLSGVAEEAEDWWLLDQVDFVAPGKKEGHKEELQYLSEQIAQKTVDPALNYSNKF
jgi:hypothetical protein